MDRRASIDIGSNSCLLLAADLERGKIVKTLANESRVTGLGRELDRTGRFLDLAMDETFEALAEYKNILKEIGVQPASIVATATEASRVAKNSGSFFAKVEKDLGIKVKVITGEAEAYYSTMGILLGEDLKKPMAIMDIGGASTEFIMVCPPGEIQESFSLPIGSVRVTNWLEEGVFEEKVSEIEKKWGTRLAGIKAETLQCVAGTMTSLANMHLDHKQFVEREVHGHVLRQSDIEKMLKEHENLKPEQFLVKFPFLGKRSKAIKGGLVLARKVCDWVDVERFKISTYGLRYGTLLEGRIKDGYLFK